MQDVDHRYQDPRISPEDRAELLLTQMTLAEKAGQLFHAMVMPGADAIPIPPGRLLRVLRWLAGHRPGGGLSPGNRLLGLPPIERMIRDGGLTHFNILGRVQDARTFATWHNRAQQLARRERLQIPITFSTDPRNHFTENIAVSAEAGMFSEWPEPLGLAALRDAELVERFAGIARQEYRSVGLSVALHPQIDVATEPRWCRVAGTFGEDVELVTEYAGAYVRGFQGPTLGPTSVATMTKHFPGGGPQRDGEDPHFPYGREQVYSEGTFELHLAPFQAALAAGTAQMMPYYGMPVGTELEEVGFAFNRQVITDLLREELGFDGVVCADWGVLNDLRFLGETMVARAWGVEHLTPLERLVKSLEAGVDQFGGEFCPELVQEAVEQGRVSEERIDESVRRLLRDKFRLGLFDQPFVDVDRAVATAGRGDFREQGRWAQRASVTLLKNDEESPLLPLEPGLRVYAEGIDPDALQRHCVAVATPGEAEVAVLRLQAPFDPRPGRFESMMHAGSLEFAAAEIERIRAVAARVPTVVDVYLDRPAVFPEIDAAATAVTVTFGCRDDAYLDVLFGIAEPLGALPFDLPRSTAAVEASRPDVPFDTTDPVYRHGSGLRYAPVQPTAAQA